MSNTRCCECDKEDRQRKRDILIAKCKEYYNNNKEKHRERSKKYEENNKDRMVLARIAYYKKNKEAFVRRIKEKRRSDLNFKIKHYLRARVRTALKNNQKSGSAVRDLGCSIEELRAYIEGKFYGSMSWENWGSVWHLDHIEPLCAFNLTDKEQFLKAAHYTNLQPLAIEDHHLKLSADIKKSINTTQRGSRPWAMNLMTM